MLYEAPGCSRYITYLGLSDSSLEMDWIKQARLNTPSLVLGELEKEISEFGVEEDGDDEDDQEHEDRLGDGG